MTLSSSELQAAIHPLMDQLQIEVSDETRRQLADYAVTLWDWNEKLNLTRHTTPEQFVQRDVLDSWQLCQLVTEGEEILDFGTGGGVPGIIMKILRPDLQMTLVESVAKKGKAVTEIAKTLRLDLEIDWAEPRRFLKKNDSTPWWLEPSGRSRTCLHAGRSLDRSGAIAGRQRTEVGRRASRGS
ncbi:MAG: RsmG family class I SAM-dependent methyltransferase [Pirellulaceae bacterium]